MIWLIETVDLDLVDKHQLYRIVEKIRRCRSCWNVVGVEDSLKGYHVTFICLSGDCVCRFVYDDPKRVDYDLRRPKHLQNVLFGEKRLVRI